MGCLISKAFIRGHKSTYLPHISKYYVLILEKSLYRKPQSGDPMDSIRSETN